MRAINFYEFELGGKKYNEPHEGQKKLINSKARFRVACFGRRAGKTTCALNILLEACLTNPNHLYWYVGPTHRMAKSIAWRYVMSRINQLPASERKKMKIDTTLLTITFTNGTVLELKGAERPDYLLGSGLNGIVVDEYAIDTYGMHPIWKEVLRPSLSDKKGWALIISTPRGYNHFFEIFDYAQNSGDLDWEAFRMPSSVNPALSKDELEAARREIGDDLYSQEYMAEFKKRSGLVYKEFDREVHVIEEFNTKLLHPKWSLELGIDFGANHPTAVVFLLFDPQTDCAYQVDEYYETHTDSALHISGIKAIEDKWLALLKQHRPRVRWGDHAATQTILDWNRVGYHVTPVVKGAGSVDTGIAAVSKRLRKDLVSGKPNYYITENCRNTIREFENYAFYSGSSAMEEDEMMRLAAKKKDAPKKLFDDAMDALRYVISHHQKVGSFGVKKPVTRSRNPLTGI